MKKYAFQNTADMNTNTIQPNEDKIPLKQLHVNTNQSTKHEAPQTTKRHLFRRPSTRRNSVTTVTRESFSDFSFAECCKCMLFEFQSNR